MAEGREVVYLDLESKEDLLRQSGESLAGRIEYVHLGPLDLLEIPFEPHSVTNLWLRGGFPDSFLANSDNDSLRLRMSFIRTYLERDVRQFGPRESYLMSHGVEATGARALAAQLASL